MAENNKKKVDNLDERVGCINEKLNDLPSILVDIRDELEIKENESLRTDYDKLRTEFEAEKDVNNQILHILAERLSQVETRQTQMDFSIENLFNKMNENMTNMEKHMVSHAAYMTDYLKTFAETFGKSFGKTIVVPSVMSIENRLKISNEALELN